MINKILFMVIEMKNYYDRDLEDYYHKYLNYDGIRNIICSKNKENSINVFYYPIIIGLFNNKTIYSINPKNKDEFFEELFWNEK